MDNILGYVSPYQKNELMEENFVDESDLTPYEFWKTLVDFEEALQEEEDENYEIDEDEEIVENSYQYWKKYLMSEADKGGGPYSNRGIPGLGGPPTPTASPGQTPTVTTVAPPTRRFDIRNRDVNARGGFDPRFDRRPNPAPAPRPAAPATGTAPAAPATGTAATTPATGTAPVAPATPAPKPENKMAQWEKANPRLAEIQRLRREGASRADINAVMYNKNANIPSSGRSVEDSRKLALERQTAAAREIIGSGAVEALREKK